MHDKSEDTGDAVCIWCWPSSSWKGMRFLKESRTTRLHFCLLLRHSATLWGKKNHPKVHRKMMTSTVRVKCCSNCKTKQNKSINRPEPSTVDEEANNGIMLALEWASFYFPSVWNTQIAPLQNKTILELIRLHGQWNPTRKTRPLRPG